MKTKIYEIHLTQAPLPQDFYEISSVPQTLYILAHEKTSYEQALKLLTLLPEKGLAIVGTRMPQKRSLEEVSRIVSELKNSDLIIVSGFAKGIDTAAHEAAIQSSLKTIAILGGGFYHLYPNNVALQNQILVAGGIILSEFPPETEPEPKNFICRNRLIGGWTKATWVVEAAQRSGALNTAKWARETHHTVFATPGYPDDPALAGNQNLMDAHHACPLWQAENFSQVWLGLKREMRKNEKVMSDQLELDLKKYAYEHYPVSFSQLRLWAVSRGWSMNQFIETARKTRLI